jgi:hypothetical protein
LISVCPGPVWALLSEALAGFFLLPPIIFYLPAPCPLIMLANLEVTSSFACLSFYWISK